MRVHVYPADEGGCGYYRLIWAAQAAAQAGHDVHIFLAGREGSSFNTLVMDDHEGVPSLQTIDHPGCDVVVLQRPLLKLLAEAVPLFQAMGVKVVVEIDDDFHSIHPQNAAWGSALPANSALRNRDWLSRACAAADRVTVTTPALRTRYGGSRSYIIPNYVPEWYLEVPKIFNSPNVVGWSGSIVSHPNDLQIMGAAFPDAVRKGSEIRVVGTGKGVARRTGLSPTQEVLSSGWVPLDQYPFRMSEIDVGVVPLELTAFNQAKSWLKGLEFAALGVPFVASPTRPYQMLHDQYGIGVIADRPKVWPKAIQCSIDHREELGQSYRDRVNRNDLVIERRYEEWVQIWTEW